MIKQHGQQTLLMKSCMDLLSNLMHNSLQNRVLICRGCKYTQNGRKIFGRYLEDDHGLF